MQTKRGAHAALGDNGPCRARTDVRLHGMGEARSARLAARQRIVNTRPPFTDGGMDHAAFVRLDLVGEASLIRILSLQLDGFRIRIPRADPGQPEVAERNGDPADAVEKLLSRPRPRDSLVDLAQDRIQTIEPLDLQFMLFAFGDVLEYDRELALPGPESHHVEVPANA